MTDDPRRGSARVSQAYGDEILWLHNWGDTWLGSTAKEMSGLTDELFGVTRRFGGIALWNSTAGGAAAPRDLT
jgi:hypothetical protein